MWFENFGNVISDLFQKKRTLNLNGYVDWHCHILPDVDDGVRTLDDSLAVLARYEQAGIAEAWLTPHVMEDIPNTPAILHEVFDKLCSAYHGTVKLHLASENMIDTLFSARLSRGEVLPIGTEGDTLLVETSYFNPPIALRDTILEVKSQGFKPLLAHPERYVYIQSLDEYRRLKDVGIEMQLNLMSLAGYYGQEVHRKALMLLDNDMYGRTGSDLHRLQHIDVISNMKLPASTYDRLTRILLKNQTDNH